jgi:endonuclease-3
VPGPSTTPAVGTLGRNQVRTRRYRHPLVERETATTIDVGASRDHRVPAGWYADIGSARGPGGFARVDRHYDDDAGRKDARQCHVDTLLGDPGSALRGDVSSPGVDVERAIASRLPDGPVEGFHVGL